MQLYLLNPSVALDAAIRIQFVACLLFHEERERERARSVLFQSVGLKRNVLLPFPIRLQSSETFAILDFVCTYSSYPPDVCIFWVHRLERWDTRFVSAPSPFSTEGGVGVGLVVDCWDCCWGLCQNSHLWTHVWHGICEWLVGRSPCGGGRVAHKHSSNNSSSSSSETDANSGQLRETIWTSARGLWPAGWSDSCLVMTGSTCNSVIHYTSHWALWYETFIE